MHRIRRFTSLAIQHAPRSSDPFSVPLLLAPGTSSHQSHNTHNNTSQPHNHIASPKKQSEQHIHRNKPPNHHIIPIEETTYEVAQYRITHPPWNRTKRPRIENEDDQKFKLTKTQEHVLHSAMKGENIFFTGRAGTGKSVLLRRIVRILADPNGCNKRVAITATTGLAAANINGRTLHSLAGWGYHPNRFNLAKTWQKLDVLVMDEVSMLSADTFDKLDRQCRKMRNVPNKPFGGIQLILTGDFMQLPPILSDAELRARIEKDEEWREAVLAEEKLYKAEKIKLLLEDPYADHASKIRRMQPKIEDYKRRKEDVQDLFCFESKAWHLLHLHSFELEQIFRQQGDLRFMRMLEDVRSGQMTQESHDLLSQLNRPIPGPQLPVVPTYLYPRTMRVTHTNLTHLSTLPGMAHIYKAETKGSSARFSLPDEVYLKEGAQVMLTKNIDGPRGLVNGSIGIVKSFEQVGTHMFPVVEFSRCTELILPITEKIEELHGFENIGMLEPEPEQYGVEGNIPVDPVKDLEKSTPSRSQLPLTLAWAYSIHKSQGQTLNKVIVDLGGIFEKGQAYVALSRAKCIDDIQVLNYRPDVIQSHPRVKQFYEQLHAKAKLHDEGAERIKENDPKRELI